MTTIGTIGIGLFVLIIVWILALIIFVIGVKYQNNIAWIALVLAAALTAIFLLIPIEKHLNNNNNNSKPESTIDDILLSSSTDKDYGFIYRNIFLAFLVGSAAVGSILFFLIHCIEPVRPKPLKTFYIQ